MPPKNNKNQSAKQPAPQGKKGGKVKKADAEFDAFLSDLQQSTKSNHEHDEQHVSLQQRRKEHKGGAGDGPVVPFDRKIQINRGGQPGQPDASQARLRELLQQMMAQQQLMSPFLSEPATDVSTETKSSATFVSAMAEMQGWRKNMEDAHLMELDFANKGATGLFGVFDGHAGKEAAIQCAAQLPDMMRKFYAEATAEERQAGDYFHKSFAMMDVALRQGIEDNSGCTAVVCVADAKLVVCGSVGDSRAVLCRGNGRAVVLADDHKPENPEEAARIRAAGGTVENNRVNGNLAMSRAMGDFVYKEQPTRGLDEQQVTAIPDVKTAARQPDDQFLIICCDGIFDVLTNQDLCTLVSELIEKRGGGVLSAEQLADVSTDVCNHCLAGVGENPGQPAAAAGTDNMTVVITQFAQ
jgi:protein phosphatase